jgi:tRNA-splicing ligase RtcB (3'-phosphate/5'-hydroxy nucleic acid ligase)
VTGFSKIIDGLPANLTIFGNHDDKTIAQMRNCLMDERATAGAICADGHLGYAQPVGGVVAYEGCISVSGVGFDIGCGNMAIKTNVLADDLSPGDWTDLAHKISGGISFGVGRTNTRVRYALDIGPYWRNLAKHPAWDISAIGELKKMAEQQLGTVGSGNHYVDVFRADSDGALWIGCHFGSRGLGHRTATHYIKAAGGKEGINVDPAILEAESETGQEYLAAMELAGQYAYAGREWVTRSIAFMIGAEILEEVHNHHNYAWMENVQGRPHWVVRKGATPLFPGQRSFVGGSLAGISVILEGTDRAPEGLMHSTVHGAGRIMSRTQAAGKTKWIKGKLKHLGAGRVDEAAWRLKIAEMGILLIGAGADEMPEVYRNLEDVLDFHKETFVRRETLRPKLVAMAGANEFDPYKD